MSCLSKGYFTPRAISSKNDVLPCCVADIPVYVLTTPLVCSSSSYINPVNYCQSWHFLTPSPNWRVYVSFVLHSTFFFLLSSTLDPSPNCWLLASGQGLDPSTFLFAFCFFFISSGNSYFTLLRRYASSRYVTMSKGYFTPRAISSKNDVLPCCLADTPVYVLTMPLVCSSSSYINSVNYCQSWHFLTLPILYRQFVSRQFA